MTRHPPTIGRRLEQWCLDLAPLECERATRVERAARRRIDGRRHVALEHDALALHMRVRDRRGRHARSAVGMGSLPVNIPVEIEAIMRVVD